MNSTFVLVENESAFNFFSSTMQRENVIWYTTSPWLLDKLNARGEKVYSLEKGILFKEMWDIGILGYAIARAICDRMNHVIDSIPSGIHLGEVFEGIIQRTFFVMAYKAWLLNRWVTESNQGKRFIVGKRSLKEIRSLDISPGRFDTLFMSIASEAVREGWQGCEIVPFNCPETGDEEMRKMRLVGQSLNERILLLLNMPLNTFLFKAMKKFPCLKCLLKKHKVKPLEAIILKECELLEESVPYLLRHGMQIAFGDLTCLKWQMLPQKNVISEEHFINSVVQDCIECYEAVSIPFDELQKAVVKILAKRIYRASEFVKPQIDHIQHYLNDVLKGRKHATSIYKTFLTNGLTTPGERLFYQCAKILKVPVFEFEHGITEGLTYFSEYRRKNSVGAKDFIISFAYSDNTTAPGGSEVKGSIISGAPQSLRKIRVKSLQRIFSRMLVNVKPWERLLVYVTSCTRNNIIYGPYGQNDLEYYQITKCIICDILRELRDAYLVKLYPANRYLDPDPFLYPGAAKNNLKVMKYFEFRYLRMAGDVIILDNPQSTLGWVWSVNVPVIFLDLPSSPLLPRIAEAFDRAIFRIDCSQDGWVEQVRSLLLLDHAELLKLWKEKEPIRKKVEEKYIFGPAGNAGKRSAKFIIEETRKWYGKDYRCK